MSMNFALTPKHSWARAPEVLILQADEPEQSRTPLRCAKAAATAPRALRNCAEFCANLGQNWGKKKTVVCARSAGAGESDFHSCAVSQLLVGRRHRFGICVPETKVALRLLCHNAPPAGRKNRIRGPIKRITSAAPRAYESDHQ